jgi:hypothetical protein
MPGLLAFLGGLLTLLAGGTGVYAALSGFNAGVEFLRGDHQAAKRHAWGTGIGAGVVLCCAAIGTSLAGLPHA